MASRAQRSQVRERQLQREDDQRGATRVHNDGEGLHGEAGAAGGHDQPLAAERSGGHGHRPLSLLLRPRAALSAHPQVAVTICTDHACSLGDAWLLLPLFISLCCEMLHAN